MFRRRFGATPGQIAFTASSTHGGGTLCPQALVLLLSFKGSHASSALVRQLAGWLPEGVSAPRQDVAERLGQWLNVNEAIALRTTQASVAAAGTAAARRATPPVDQQALHTALQRELQRVRAVLIQSITARDASHRSDPNELDIEWALFHQRLNDQQRRMELSVEALRGHVRQALGQSTPELAQLAALDAAMEPLLAGREQRLLGSLPAFLKARFVALRQQVADPSDTAPDDLHWLQTFANEFEQTLLAELDLRLQPVIGLIESIPA
nr:DUF3348 family protein [Hydrogenophaga sp.]